MNKLICGDAYQELTKLPSESIDCCVTSPPYWGQRDYGVEGQLGLETTPKEYLDNLTAVFMEVFRILKSSGSLWLNIADTYASSSVSVGTPNGRKLVRLKPDVKLKELVGIPWRLAFQLRENGYYLRQDIIWQKKNPVPEPVTDRCTRAHEYVFLLTKTQKYYYNQDAVREPFTTEKNYKIKKSKGSKISDCGASHYGLTSERDSQPNPLGRNRHSVWEVSKKRTKHAHTAPMPGELCKLCILAGCPESGIVLDPFNGTGTTTRTATELNRGYVGIELNPDFSN